jgi:uncharacterized membrane protein
MSNFFSFLTKNITEIMLVFLLFYAITPFLSPVLFSMNPDSVVAKNIQNIYTLFCHQRPQSSLFLFGGENSQHFYTLEELKELSFVPKDSLVSSGAGYWGNEEIGYKVAYCIRDIGIYSALSLIGLLLVIFMNVKKKIVKVHWSVILFLMLPMALDGIFQFFVMFFDISWIPEAYLLSMIKKLITGALFGIGGALLIFPNLKDASRSGYNGR